MSTTNETVSAATCQRPKTDHIIKLARFMDVGKMNAGGVTIAVAKSAIEDILGVPVSDSYAYAASRRLGVRFTGKRGVKKGTRFDRPSFRKIKERLDRIEAKLDTAIASLTVANGTTT